MYTTLVQNVAQLGLLPKAKCCLAYYQVVLVSALAILSSPITVPPLGYGWQAQTCATALCTRR